MRGTDSTLLPVEVQARLHRREVTIGQYGDMLTTFGDAALCDHAEVYAMHATLWNGRDTDTTAGGILLKRVLPELVARVLNRGHAAEFQPTWPDEDYHWKRVLPPKARAELKRERDEAIAHQRQLAATNDDQFAAVSEAHLRVVALEFQLPSYDHALYHRIMPELIQRLRTRATTAAE